jgi:xylulose-5-phosphate/fructose-6-phosphate phosphoketolase
VGSTPKGWTGPKVVDGLPAEGSFRSHQVPLADLSGNPEHLTQLEEWLHSYRPEKLFDERGALRAELAALAPDRGAGSNLEDSSHRSQPSALRHLDIDHGGIGLSSPGELDGLFAVGRSADHLEPAAEGHTQHRPNHWVVVCDHQSRTIVGGVIGLSGHQE